MSIRTSEKTVTFTKPFVVAGFDETLPAGDYLVETDEELLEGLSFPAYRCVLTLLHLHKKAGRPGLTETLPVDPHELEAALKRDRAASSDGDLHHTNQKEPTWQSSQQQIQHATSGPGQPRRRANA